MKPYQFNTLFGMPTSQLANKYSLEWKDITINNRGEITLDKPKQANYIVVEGDWYIFSDRFQTGSEADAYARQLAEENPGTDFHVYHRDFTFRGTAQVEVSRS